MIQKLGKWLTRIAWLIWILVMLLVGLKLALDNTQSVQLKLFGWQAPERSLGTIVCFTLLGGVLLGWSASIGPWLKAKQRARRLEKQLGQTRQEVASLRTAPLKGQ